MDLDTAYPLVRSVSKTGGFSLELEQAQQLAAEISDEEVVELYVLIRDESNRDEKEWRSEFLELFPGCEATLPPAQSPPFDPQSLFEIINRAASSGDEPDEYYDTFDEFLLEAEENGFDLSSLSQDGLSLRAYATKQGKLHLVELLDEYGID